jgi:ubiquinone/menaquinone biosynthesis C-methylase UbiE
MEIVRSQLYSRFVARFINKHVQKDSKVLEAGCGSASFERFVRGRYYGIDWSEAALKIAKKNVKNPKNIFRGDITRTKFKDKEFDILISQGILEFQNDWHPFLKEFSRVTKGNLFIIFPSRISLPGIINLFKRAKNNDKIYKRIYLSDEYIKSKARKSLKSLKIKKVLTMTGFSKVLVAK